MSPYKKFNSIERGHGSQPKDQNKGDGRKPLRCWNYGGEHQNRYFPSRQHGKPHIYNALEAQIVGYVGHIIPWIHVAIDTKQEDHTCIIEMECKLSDKVFSISVDPRSNYIYISLDLVDNFFLNK